MNIFLLLFLFIFYHSAAQVNTAKQFLFSESGGRLCEIKNNVSSLVSDNGRIVVYKVRYHDNDSLVIRSSSGKLIKSIYERCTRTYGETKVEISSDGRTIFFSSGIDSLGIFHSENKKLFYLPDVKMWSLAQNHAGQYLVYLVKSSNKLVITNNSSGQQKYWAGVTEFIIGKHNKLLVAISDGNVLWYDLITGKIKTIWNGSYVSGVTLDKQERQVAFYSAQSANRSIKYFAKGADSCRTLVENRNGTKRSDNVKITEGNLVFSDSGESLFYELSYEDTNYIENESGRSVKVWSYLDDNINHQKSQSSVVGVVNITQSSISELTRSGTRLISGYGNKYILEGSVVNFAEYYWNAEDLNYWIVSVKDGQRKLVKKFDKSISAPYISMSPAEKYVIWMEPENHQYYSYDIFSGISRNISSNVPVSLFDSANDIAESRLPYGIAGWLSDDGRVWVYDRYDIWELDPLGKEKPKNITRGWGRKEGIFIRKVGDELFASDIIDGSCILSGFSPANKTNGFWKFHINSNFTLNKAALKNFLYYNNNTYNSRGTAYVYDLPQKAKNADVYIVRRMRADRAPGLFITSDFIQYKPLSFLNDSGSESNVSTQLLSWKADGNRMRSGILYKPETFDCRQRYPVIFLCYEKRSDELNHFKTFSLSTGELNIPLFVRNGYLVFIPDMHFNIDSNARDIAGTLMQAVQQLSRLPWIDTSRMGIQGHSFGGYEVLLAISQTNIFKAAQVSAGPSNLINGFSEIFADNTRQSFYEFSQPNMGGPPWQQATRYVSNSPLFKAMQIKTPLLLMHNRLDAQVYVSQSEQMFLSLKKAGSPVYLLQYDQELHTLNTVDCQIDFTTRQLEFFNYYLKNDSRPAWINQ